jgi:hypothetical protein
VDFEADIASEGGDGFDDHASSPTAFQTHPSWLRVRGEDRQSMSPVRNASEFPVQGSISCLHGDGPEVSVQASDAATNTEPEKRSYTKPVKPDFDLNSIADGEIVTAEDGRFWMPKTVPTKGGKTRRIWTLVKHVASVIHEDAVAAESDGEEDDGMKTELLMQMGRVIGKLIESQESKDLIDTLDHLLSEFKQQPDIQRMRASRLADEERELEARSAMTSIIPGMEAYMDASDDEDEAEAKKPLTPAKTTRSYTKVRPTTPAKGMNVGATAQDHNGRTWTIYERRTKNGGVCQVWKLATQ